VEHLQGYSCHNAQITTSYWPFIVTSFVAMLEYSDDPACSHKPYSSSYSVLCRQTFALPPEGFSLLQVRVPHCDVFKMWSDAQQVELTEGV